MTNILIAILKYISGKLNKLIRYLPGFRLLVFVRDFYSYFTFILGYLKVFTFYNFFRHFFRILALLNILVSLFLLNELSDFSFGVFFSFILFTLPDFASDFFANFPSYLRKFTFKLLSYFKHKLDEEPIDDNVKKTSLRDLFNEEPKDEVKTPKTNYWPYLLLFLFIGGCAGGSYVYWDDLRPVLAGIWNPILHYFVPNPEPVTSSQGTDKPGTVIFLADKRTPEGDWSYKAVPKGGLVDAIRRSTSKGESSSSQIVEVKSSDSSWHHSNELTPKASSSSLPPVTSGNFSWSATNELTPKASSSSLPPVSDSSSNFYSNPFED